MSGIEGARTLHARGCPRHITLRRRVARLLQQV